MAKKKQQQSTAPVMTRGQRSKAAMEAQRIRNLYTAGIALGTVVVLVLAFAAIFTYVIRPNAEVASVNGTSIKRDAYNKLRRWGLYQQIQQTAFQQQLSGQGVSDTTALDALRNQLRNVENEGTLDSTVLQSLVDSEVLRQKSTSELSINPTDDDMLKRALEDFEPQPTAPPSSITPSPAPSQSPTSNATSTPSATGTLTPSATRTPTQTPTRGSPTNTPTATNTWPPVPSAEATARSSFDSFINAIDDGPGGSSSNVYCTYGCPSFSRDDYMKFIIEPQVRQEQATEQLSATKIVTDVEQVRVQHILTATLEGAEQIRTWLDEGQSFDTLVVEQSSDTGSVAQGGIYEWFPREDSGYVEPFAEASFTTPVGEYSEPVQTEFGYHIIRVLEKEVRPLTQSQTDSKRQKIYNDWFTAAKLASTISPSTFMAPTPTSPPLIEPTPIPGTSDATPSPAASVTGTGNSDTAPTVGTTSTATTAAGSTATTAGTAPTAAVSATATTASQRNTPEPSATP